MPLKVKLEPRKSALTFQDLILTLMQFWGQPLAHAMGWTLLHFCWQGAVIAVSIFLIVGCSEGRMIVWVAAVPLAGTRTLAMALPSIGLLVVQAPA